jgi:hypothetical protein
MTDQNIEQNNTEEVKEKVIGDFKPSRKFLNFVSAISGARIRLISDIAFVKGDKLSGLGLDGVIFKVTICDEGTIKFEEVDTTVTDEAQRKRLIEDICGMDVTGYAQKFVVSGLEFADKDGKRCYLEVEEKKPIDKLKSIFDEMEPKEISTKGLSFLDELLGGDTDTVEETVEVVAEVKEEVVVEEPKSHAESMIAESFRKMNEDKVNELKNRIEDKEKDIRKYKAEITQAENKLKTDSEQLRVLSTRLETMSPGDEPNGYVFFVTEEQKNETGLDESTKAVADKIADLMNLKKEVLFDYLTGGFYKIKIGKKGENDKKLESIDRDILEKLLSIDPLGKISMSDSNEVEYRGDLNWHQLTGKMIRKGFEQDPEFNKISGSNSYEAKTEDDGGSYTGTKPDCSHESCGCSDEDKQVDKMKGAIETMAKNLGMKGVNFGQDGIELIPEDKKDTEFKTQLIKNIETPQTIVIVGSHVEGKQNYSITDDYTGFDLSIAGKKVSSGECDGFFNILTVPEFLSFMKKDENGFGGELDFGSSDVFLLDGFSGEIRMGVMDEDGNSDYKFDPSDDCIANLHDDYLEVIIDLPVGTNWTKVEDPKNIISLLRDEKINTVLND